MIHPVPFGDYTYSYEVVDNGKRNKYENSFSHFKPIRIYLVRLQN
jgi:hypothetical protein